MARISQWWQMAEASAACRRRHTQEAAMWMCLLVGELDVGLFTGLDSH